MNRDAFREALLGVMERKVHWSNEAFATGGVARDRMHIHFEQEYGAFVRDFPIFVGRAYVQCPIASVRRDLAENLYEEETGAIAAKAPHPVLFLEIPRGFGCDMKRFDSIELLPGTRAYRDAIDRHTQNQGWECAAAVTTLFIEGTQYERGELDDRSPKRPMPPLEEHPLHVHYGLPLDALALPRVHRSVEGGHRTAAWRTILDHVDDDARERVVQSMEAALAGWLQYKDAVANAVGLEKK
jgi:pyrroloquinoline-quinone synthase